MGEAEIHPHLKNIIISSNIITYGNAADDKLTELMRDEIESMWNEPRGIVYVNDIPHQVVFKISGTCQHNINVEEISANIDPRNNYFRIEEYAHGNISFVDGLGCNSGYFKLENLYAGSTTAAHEYGHTIGLDHPEDMDYRGKGIPGIMYPRGTLVDPQFQYDPSKPAGAVGGTMHPMYRKVLATDILSIRWEHLRFQNKKAVIGDFTNVWHGDQGG